MSTEALTVTTPLTTSAGVTEYITCRKHHLDAAGDAVRARGLGGAEVFMDDVKPRTSPLTESADERSALLTELGAAHVRRIHASYWAAPTAFVANVQFGELVERFDGSDRVREYFGDLTGAHMFTRWRDEYALAGDLGADAYVFHLIDYMPVDGAWEFTIDRSVVLEAMVVLTQRFLRELDEHGLIDEDSPVIELENAGWGLEFGAQTADDFAEIFARVYDPAGRLRLGWDLNHLLHAVGVADGSGAFLLPDAERTAMMDNLEQKAAGSIHQLSIDWIEQNVLDERLIGRISALHVSDCTAKTVEYFRNGELDEAHAIDGDWDARKAEGLRLVLEHYDNHICLGDGVLEAARVRRIIDDLAARQPLMVLHELKNASDLWADLDRQRTRLWSTPESSGR